MREGYLENLDYIVVDGLDETFAANMDVDDVVSPSILLVDFTIDSSGSMREYIPAMKAGLEAYKDEIVKSTQADEMLLSKTLFDSTIKTGGYVAAEDFNTDYSAGGFTKLYDAIIDRRKRMLAYMEQLKNNGTNTRGCFIILSDGEDNDSRSNVSDARNAIQDMISREFIVAFIAFGQKAFDVADKIGVEPQNVIKVSNDASELKRVLRLTSKAASSASKKASSGAGGTANGGFFDV